MRDEWYSDSRDLVKWGVLVELAELHRIAVILQVAYYRPTRWDERRIEIDGRVYPLPLEVVNHFRKIRNVTALRSRVPVTVLDAPCHDRDGYLQCTLTAIRKLPKPAIVFLDPDTGLEPRGRAGLEHVLETELREIWHALRPGDLLVFYQHQTNRGGRPWVEEKQAQFDNAIGVKSRLAQGTEIARDVAFFFSQRLDSSQTAQAAR